MTDLNDESRSREEGEQGFFGRLRGFLGARNDTDTLRDTIEELIELEEDVAGADNAEELALLRNVLSVRDVAVETLWCRARTYVPSRQRPQSPTSRK